tara:strand:+ start:649 stop:1725 length:1077 start_codon:yes stop_codon:yes gene_type:complete
MKVCIIGSGLSALALAKALINKNINVEIVSKNKQIKINQSRTLGISKSNFNYFNKNIVNIEKIIWKIKKIEILSDNLKNEKILNFENKNDQIFSIVKNSEIYKILYKSLFNSSKYKKIKFKKKISNFDSYDLIINTDYSNILTKKYFNKKILKNYNSLAYTTIIKHKIISNNIATQIFTKKGPLAFLPISNQETSIVYSIYNSRIDHKTNIVNLINHYNFKYKIKKIEKIDSFELKSFILRSYYHNNILAFGDLLHRIHPLAGQGFNMTIRDIKSLIQIINKKINLGLPLNKSINIEFEKKVKHKNFIFSNGVDLIYELFNFERKLKNNFLTKSIKLFGGSNQINKMFKKIADYGVEI